MNNLENKLKYEKRECSDGTSEFFCFNIISANCVPLITHKIYFQIFNFKLVCSSTARRRKIALSIKFFSFSFIAFHDIFACVSPLEVYEIFRKI